MNLNIEQKNTVRIFRKSYEKMKSVPMLIYGTGINAEAIIETCKDYNMIGVLDAGKTGEEFCGLKVMSEDAAIVSGCKVIVVVARPSVHEIIYKRICSWTLENDIHIYNINGEEIKNLSGAPICDSEYFSQSLVGLKKKILEYEVISFDIFDTLLTRKLYLSDDVFEILGRRHNESDYAKKRRKVVNSLDKNASIYQIYTKLKGQTKITIQDEINLEKKILEVREEMKQCFDFALEKQKKIYIVSDMYFTSEILADILNFFKITGYEEIIVSCEYHTDKSEGLFEILKSKIGERKCLHIGDNKERDIESAKKSGIDAFHILSPIAMLELSTYKNILVYNNKLEYRNMIGLLAESLFNNPFSLQKSNGRPTIKEVEKFGYCIFAPIVLSVVNWMSSMVQKDGNSLILFSARDGYLFEKIYRLKTNNLTEASIVADKYLRISRNALKLLQRDGNEEFLERYKAYVMSLGVELYDKIYFFDFMSRGSCQLGLEKVLHRKLEGLYVQRSLAFDERDKLVVNAFYKEQSAGEQKRRIFAICDFLECVFSSPEPSFQKIDEKGNFVYEKELRSSEQINTIMKIQKGILDYCEKYYFLQCGSDDECFLPYLACDEMLNWTKSEYSFVEIKQLKELSLDDNGCLYNKGQEVFL